MSSKSLYHPNTIPLSFNSIRNTKKVFCLEKLWEMKTINAGNSILNVTINLSRLLDLWFPCQGVIKFRFLLIISLTGREDQSTRCTDGWPTSFLLIQYQVVKYGVRDFENWVERYRLKSCNGEGGMNGMNYFAWSSFCKFEWMIIGSFICLSLSLNCIMFTAFTVILFLNIQHFP